MAVQAYSPGADLLMCLLDPFGGLLNRVLAWFGIPGPGWFTDPNLALWTIIGVHVWKGVGIATLIFIAGLVAIPQEYYEATCCNGASPAGTR